MPFDAVLFDKDGTLFDFAGTWNSWSAGVIRSLASGSDALASKLAGAIQFDLQNQCFHPHSIAVAGTNAEVTSALLPYLPDHQQSELERFLEREASTAPLVEAAPLADLLTELRASGAKLGVMTNDSELSALSQLDRAGVREQFDFVAGYDSGYGEKPDPAPLLAFCRKVDVHPARTIMVGDSLHDLLAGKAAGMTRIGVLTGTAERSDLLPHADVVLNHIGEIPDWFRQNQ